MAICRPVTSQLQVAHTLSLAFATAQAGNAAFTLGDLVADEYHVN